MQYARIVVFVCASLLAGPLFAAAPANPAFDTELLATLNRSGSEWLEVPVTWTEKKGGKVKPVSDAWRMFKAVLRIRQRNA